MITLKTGYKYLGGLKTGAKSFAPLKNPLLANVSASNLSPGTQDSLEIRAVVPFLKKQDWQIKELLKKALQTKCIGHGAEASVYKIPGFDYVLRVSRYCEPDFRPKLNREMSERDKFNHYVAKIGSDVQIGEFINGENATFATDSALTFFEKQHELNRKIIDMPDSAYFDFLKRIFDAAKMDMSFDFAGRNVIVDFANKKFVPIDFEYGFPQNPRSRVFNPILCMQSGFSVKEPDLQFKFFEKIINSFCRLLKSDYDFSLQHCRLEPLICALSFNISKLPPESFAQDVKVLNWLIKNAVTAKTMNTSNPFFYPKNAVGHSIDELSAMTSEFVKKYIDLQKK